MIEIPINIGDLILTGKFKNKKVTVKEIGKDEFGNPTINGKSIMKIRVPKLYQKQENYNIMEISIGDTFKHKGSGKPGYPLSCEILDRTTKGFKVKEMWPKNKIKTGFYEKSYFDINDKPSSMNQHAVWIKENKTMRHLKEALDVQIKNENGKFNIYRCQNDGKYETKPFNTAPYETKELAELAALNRGFVVNNEDLSKKMDIKIPKPTKAEPVKHEKVEELKLSKEQEIKLENYIRRIIKEANPNKSFANMSKPAKNYVDFEKIVHTSQDAENLVDEMKKTKEYSLVNYKSFKVGAKPNKYNNFKQSYSYVVRGYKPSKPQTEYYLENLIRRVMKEAKMNHNRNYENIWKNKLNSKQRYSILNTVYGSGFEVELPLANSYINGTIPLETNTSEASFIKIQRLIDGLISANKISENTLNKKKDLTEVDVTDRPDLTEKAKRYAELANKMKVMEAELKQMEAEYGQLDDEFRQTLESVSETKDTFIRAGKLLIKIERAGYDKKTSSYKTGFEYLYNKVNGTMKNLAEEALKMTEGVAKVKSKISVVHEAISLTGIKNWFVQKIKSLFNLNNQANQELDKLEKMV